MRNIPFKTNWIRQTPRLRNFNQASRSRIYQTRTRLKKTEDEKDKEIASLRAQITRRDNIKQTDEVFKDAGLTVGDDVLNMVVVDDDKQTYANVQALIKYTNQIQSGVKKELLKGSTPRNNGKPAMTKVEISKIKDPIKRQKAIAENLDLYKH